MYSDLIRRFEELVDSEIERCAAERSNPFLSPCPKQWRQQWVNSIAAVCRPLNKILYDPSTGSRRGFGILQDHQVNSVVSIYDRFCWKTLINHILDDQLATFVIADCLATLTYLVSEISRDSTATSFNLSRIGAHHNVITQALVHAGFWRERWPDRDLVLSAIREVHFPIEELYDAKSWHRV